MSILRFIAWVALLIIVVSVAYALFIGKELAQQLIQVPVPQWALPRYEYRPECTNHTYIDPWTVANSYGLSIKNNAIVYKYTNTSEEAEKTLNDASIDPELYYYYYSILTALVAKPMGNHSTVYDLHPLPVSQNDVENLTKKSLCIFFPSKGFEVPRVRPALLSNESYYVERGSVVNVVTYLPTANISIAYSIDYSNPLLVEGYAEAIISAFATEVVPCGHYHNEYECGNKTCIIDHSYYCTKYSISYTYSFKLLENSNIIDRYEYLGSLSVLADSDSSYDVAGLEWGWYHGYSPFAKAWVRVREWGETSCSTSETNTTVYTACTTTYYADFSTETRSRGARFYKAVIPIVAERREIWSGVLSTMSIAVDINGTRLVLPVNTSKPLLSINISAYPWESKKLSTAILLSDATSIAGSRVLSFTRSVKVASINISTSRPSIDLSKWGWGSTINVKPIVNAETWSIRAPNINITRIQRLLHPNPGELWLEKLVLRYIHDKIKWFIVNSSAMNQYFDAFMWLLASQMPIGMANCTPHNTTTPILDALCSKCGSEAERVKILCNVTGYSLNASIKNFNLYWPSYNSTAINATVCMAKISSYPELWELYNETKEIVYVLPEDSHYLVFYNVYENSPFGGWRRVKQ